MTDTSNAGTAPGLGGVGGPLAGTDARPDEAPAAGATAHDPDAQGGENAQQDALRAHAHAQSADGPVRGGLDDTRAHLDDDASDNGEL